MSRVAVIGGGYVGLPTAGVLARFGHDVVCAERDEVRYGTLAEGQVPIVEEGLAELLRIGVQAGRLRFVRQAKEAARGAEFVFLCVATPEREDGSADLSYVKGVAADIADVLEPDAVVVNKSTVPVGTAELVEGMTGATVVSNPEFLREGTAVRDSLRPDRVVVGAEDADAARRVAELFSGTGAPVIVTDTVSAETIKYASNAFLATKLSFVNALARLCESVGADVCDVVKGIGSDRRIGFEFLRPGPGWGGSCLPKDTDALLQMAAGAGYDFALLRAAVDANREAHEHVVTKLRDACGGSLDGATVAVWGLTFKAGTDDRRKSPAVAIAQRVAGLGAAVRAYDPTARKTQADDLAGIELSADPYDACRGAHVLAVLTEWDELRGLDFAKVAGLMRDRRIVDARNHLDLDVVRAAGFSYQGVGRSG